MQARKQTTSKQTSKENKQQANKRASKENMNHISQKNKESSRISHMLIKSMNHEAIWVEMIVVYWLVMCECKVGYCLSDKVDKVSLYLYFMSRPNLKATIIGISVMEYTINIPIKVSHKIFMCPYG